MAKVFVFSDLHLPFVSQSAYRAAFKALGAEKDVTHIVQIGDIEDQYMFSRYAKDTRIRDIKQAQEASISFWKRVQAYCPRAKCHQLLGNHDIRMSKRIAEVLPELFDVFDPLERYRYKGVTTAKSDRDYLTIDGVVYTHGWLSKSLDHAIYFGKPCVHGHTHRPSVTTKGPRLWSMDVGVLADQKSTALSYTMSKASQWRAACGVVEDGVPRLILL